MHNKGTWPLKSLEVRDREFYSELVEVQQPLRYKTASERLLLEQA
jgi:hypothetical protein